MIAPSGARGGPEAIACALVIRAPPPGRTGAATAAAAEDTASLFSTAAASPQVESGSGVASTTSRFRSAGLVAAAVVGLVPDLDAAAVGHERAGSIGASVDFSDLEGGRVPRASPGHWHGTQAGREPG